MSKDWKYLLYLSIAFGLFLVLKLVSPKQYNWNITFSADDKNPYGGYALHELIETNFPKGHVKHTFKTLYELKDSIRARENVFIVAANFSAGQEDTDVLLNHVHNGGAAFISANYFYGKFADTLKLSVDDNLFSNGTMPGMKDTSFLKFASLQFDTVKAYHYRRDNIHNYFSGFDTTRTTVIARNQHHQPVTIRLQWGKGNLILNSTPMVMANIYILANDNHEFVSSNLSYLPNSTLHWTEYYQRGRMEVETPLRFILQSEPLRWAYYITIISILVFMIFEVKRRQRIIPIIKPLNNTSLEFVNTIGNLYFQDGQHKGVAEKKINYFFDQIRSRYWLNTNLLNDEFVVALAKKSGKEESTVRPLVNLILAIRSSPVVTDMTLIELSGSIENFNSVNAITQ